MKEGRVGMEGSRQLQNLRMWQYQDVNETLGKWLLFSSVSMFSSSYPFWLVLMNPLPCLIGLVTNAFSNVWQ